MPPKKAQKMQESAAPRRSARLASREGSVASDTTETGLYPPHSPSHSHFSLTGAHSGTSVKKEVPKKTKKHEGAAFNSNNAVDVILREEKARRAAYIQRLTLPQLQAVTVGIAAQFDESVDEARSRNEELEQQLHDTIKERDHARANQHPSLARLCYMDRVYGNVLAKQDAISQQAEEETEPEDQSATRSSPQQQPAAIEPAATTSAASPVVEPESEQPVPTPRPKPGLLARIFSPFTRKRPAEEDEGERFQKRMRTDETPQITPSVQHQPCSPRDDAAATTEVATASEPSPPVEDAQRTPRSATQRPTAQYSARDYVGPSAKNPRVPTSLSTITEYSEPSFLSSYPEATPSKPSRVQSQRSLQVPQNTPTVRSHRTQGSQSPSSVPQSTSFLQDSTSSSLLQGTSTMAPPRRSAQLRAQASVKTSTTPASKQYAWEKRDATPKPREPNADARLAKLNQIRELQRQLDELEKDEDIKDIEAHSIHRRKRVKIDDLAVIPHNRPGDSVSTFRVPDIDSDEEMSVDEDIDQSSNMFAQAETTQELPPPPPPAAHVPESPAPTLTFPGIAPRPADYHVTEEYQEEAGRLFVEGFEAWLATR
ncbi:hypothetical protein LTR37_002721 [Vermiconidia calcicola]|uniref:Uncharacterized protein n=1 Tax=Vermiconidia calcicola TaxID=1690605 RepID=A0ACC3NT95_9PEZI|nr:hypothetical protein LTR37_002721 [Vermiconidia calcicola]